MSRRVVVVLAAVLIAAGCGGDQFVEDDTPPTTTEIETVDTTEAATTSEAATTTEAEDDTPAPIIEPTGPVFTLTGLPGEVDRSAVAIKIDNNSKARPQFGLNQADVLYEVIVESKLTRFLAVFHSTPSDPVGPVRSARTSDILILGSLGDPLFANSGANAYTLNAIARSSMVNANYDSFPSEYYREGTRVAPHNLMTSITGLWDQAGDRGGRPSQMFSYLADGQELPAGAEASSGFSVNYGNQSASYAWNADSSMWVRTQDGTLHVDALDEPVAAPNIVVLESSYGTSAADPISPEVVVTGGGRAWVFTGGTVQVGQWSRSAAGEVALLTATDGTAMLLAPGRTHVLLPRVGQTTLN